MQQIDRQLESFLHRARCLVRCAAVALAIAACPGLSDPQAQERSGKQTELASGQFRSPETAVWDERRDVYLVSSINGPLTALDDNGFISRLSPDGTSIERRWIDGTRPEVTLHGPKGMLLTDEHLIVADVHTVRYFDRLTGKPAREVPVAGSYMLNDLARATDGTLYVSDLGGNTAEHPGAVYRITDDQPPVRIAHGMEYDRPDGLVVDAQGLLVAPFEQHASELYRLDDDGARTTFANAPQPKLDGLIVLPDGSYVVTSWTGKAIYRLLEGRFATVAADIRSPAQIGYDSKRQRLIVPVLKENKLLAIDLPVQGTREGASADR